MLCLIGMISFHDLYDSQVAGKRGGGRYGSCSRQRIFQVDAMDEVIIILSSLLASKYVPEFEYFG